MKSIISKSLNTLVSKPLKSKFWQRPGGLLTALGLSIATLATVVSPAYGQGFGTVTPGGVEPNLERRTLPKASELPEFDIPAVPDRPLDADEGPKLKVTRFKLEGAEDIAGTSITQKSVSLLLEDYRKTKPEGFTVGQLQDAANQVTRLYRQNGVILAQAIVPRQKIDNGVVIIRILPGKLGQVSTINNENYSEQLMTRPFDDLVDQPVQASQVESALLRLTDLPGLEAVGIFRPGQEVGETELVLNSQEEDAYQFFVIADDHGVETTGKQRIIGGVTFNNLIGTGDRLSLTALQSFDPEDSTYGSIYYESLIFMPELSAGFSYSTNDYAISQSLDFPETDGDTEIASVFSKYSFVRSRTLNIEGKLNLSTKRAEVYLPEFNTSFGEDKLTVVSAIASLDSVDSMLGGGVNELKLAYHVGLEDVLGSMDSDGDNGNSIRTGGSGENSGGDFQTVAFQAARLQLVSTNTVMLFRLEGQYSDDLLSSMEQYSMGGPNSVRAYPVSEYIRDKALFASTEFILSVPNFTDEPGFFGDRRWNEVVKLSVFLDYALGKRNDPNTSFENKKEELSGAGIGLELNFTETAFLKIEAANAITSQDASNDHSTQLWFSAGFEF